MFISLNEFIRHFWNVLICFEEEKNVEKILVANFFCPCGSPNKPIVDTPALKVNPFTSPSGSFLNEKLF